MFHYTIVTPTSERPYYVYLLLRPNGRPFYIGKGCHERVLEHEREARRGHCRCHKCNVIRKIWRGGNEVHRAIIFVTANEQEAFDYEARLIDQIGLANLTNMKPGGGVERNPLPDKHVYEMTDSEYKLLLNRCKLTPKEYERQLTEWRRFKLRVLTREWRVLRCRQRFADSDEVMIKIEEVRLSLGMVRQHELF